MTADELLAECRRSVPQWEWAVSFGVVKAYAGQYTVSATYHVVSKNICLSLYDSSGIGQTAAEARADLLAMIGIHADALDDDARKAASQAQHLRQIASELRGDL